MIKSGLIPAFVFGSGIFLNLNLFCSGATEQSSQCTLPADVSINKDAGRGNWLIVTLQLDSGQNLPVIVDTGAGGTVLHKSLAPKLGKRLGPAILHHDGKTITNAAYAAPRLYLGGTPLLMTGDAVICGEMDLPARAGRKFMGILGMDVLEHYCIQLDFAAGKMRFLDGQHADKSNWGKAFAISPLSDQDSRPAIAQNLLGRKGTLSLIDSGFLGDGSLMPKYFQLWTNQAVVPTNQEARSPDGVFDGKEYPFVDLSEKDWPSDAIGLNFLARHLVTLDFPNHTMYLRCQSIGPLLDPALARFKPITDEEPETTIHVRAIVQDWIGGTQRADDYTASAWKKLQSKQKDIQAFTKRIGDLVSLTLVERSRGVFGWRRSYTYRVQFTKATVLTRFDLNHRNKVTSGYMKPAEWKEAVE